MSREALRESQARMPGFERYPKHSLILCTSCARPLYRLTRGIWPGESTASPSEYLTPVSLADLAALQTREDIPPGLRAWVRSLSLGQRLEHVGAIPVPRNGDPMICPFCHEVYVQARAVGKDELLDQAYVIELVVLAPDGKLRVPTGRGDPWRPITTH